MICGPLGFVALEAGWVVTEVGRQPWVIHGILRTSEVVTPASGVPAMFYAFALLYLTLGTTVVLLLWNLRSAATEAVLAPQEVPVEHVSSPSTGGGEGPMTHDTLAINLAAAVALVGLMIYAALGGADFGGGVWDLFATGPRRHVQRQAIARAMGPVWEANHVWLIFVIVVLFTCFPYGYGPIGIALFVPFHLALAGIMLRGAAFVFRAYARPSRETTAALPGTVFGIASVISPFLLGPGLRASSTQGGVRVNAEGTVSPMGLSHWLSPYALGCGLLALSTCAYLAAVYLTVETDGELREDFRLRAIVSGTTTAGLALLVLVFVRCEADWFFRQLVSPHSWPVLAAGLACFAASAWAVFGRRYRLSRVFAAGEIVLLLLGWGLAHQPYLVYPDITLQQAAAPAPTIAFLLATLPFGAGAAVAVAVAAVPRVQDDEAPELRRTPSLPVPNQWGGHPCPTGKTTPRMPTPPFLNDPGTSPCVD